MPEVLERDFTKVDLSTLRHDIPKWYSLMPLSSQDWWNLFLLGIDKDTSLEEICPLLELINDLQRPAQPEMDISVLQDLVKFREKELAPLNEVNNLVINRNVYI